VTSGDDKAVKRWDSVTLAEKKVYPKQSDWPQALAISPDNRRIAVGRHDGSLGIYDSASGMLLREPIKAAWNPTPVAMPTSSEIPGVKLGDRSRKPRKTGGVTLTGVSLGSISPVGMVRGNKVRLTLAGGNISDAIGVYFDDNNITGTIVAPPDPNRGIVRVDAVIGPNTSAGIHNVFVQAPRGTTNRITFAVGAWPEITQKEPNDTLETAQDVQFPCTVVGALDSPGDVDSYRVQAKAGQEIVFEIVAQPIRSRNPARPHYFRSARQADR